MILWKLYHLVGIAQINTTTRLSRFVFIQMLNPTTLKTYLTFDDVLLLPGHSKVLPTEVSLKTKLTQKISINCPLVSAPMDTVT